MRNRFDNELESLGNQLIEMGSLIESAIDDAVKALKEQDLILAKKAILFDDEIDEKERCIERCCLKLLLHQQPVATDLRMISTVLKMITDMERIGDHAADISELTKHLSCHPYQSQLQHIPRMAEETVGMVKQSIDAFIQKDRRMAQQVIDRDDIVDELFNKVKQNLIDSVRSPSKPAYAAQQAIDLLLVAKYFERIGDHAVNIAEWVIFSITGLHKEQRIL